MVLFDKFRELTVNEGLNRARMEPNAVLLDVRTKEEFKKGHVSGAVNIPMDRLEQIKNRIRSADTTLYVVGDYNHQPRKAVKELKKLGYTHAVPSGTMEEHHGILKK